MNNFSADYIIVRIIPFEGRLWIHAASKVPEPTTIQEMEDFYREIYAVNGITDLKFPEHYPTSRLLGMFLYRVIVSVIIDWY